MGKWYLDSPLHSWWAYGGVALLILASLSTIGVYSFMMQAPRSFPVEQYVTIPEGATMQEATLQLHKYGVIRSPLALKLSIKVKGNERGIIAGEYYFDQPLTAWEVAERISTGKFGITPLAITIPEGATSYQIAQLLTEKLHGFDAVTFSERAKLKEGYLFPDTYYFMPNATIEDVLSAMEKNFYDRVADIEPLVASSTFTMHDVLTMASLLEKEARRFETRQMIAGVIMNRLEIDMPLQIDAVFGYIYGTNTFSPKFSHLATDSPYNTYKYRGLPPGPIANPGLESIKAALEPMTNGYYYYLTGRDGNMYYSETYEGHLWNRRMYLD